jgi:two-component system, NarL family, response regulator DegU
VDTIRVVLADDHPFMRKGICSMLNKTEDIEVVGEARDGFEALTLVHNLDPDVLLLDMEMAGLQGMDVAKELEAVGSKVPILALSAYEDKQYILGILATGAAGYLTKDELPETIVRAIRGVAQGESGWVSGKVAKYLRIWQKHQH